MKVIGLTGGIGSGKSTVAQLFESYGIPCYNSDFRAKYVMNHNEVLREQIKTLLGEESYNQENLNRQWIAKKVFENASLLQKLNALVHPAVKEDFEHWAKQQKTSYILKEAAILIESGAYKSCDKIIVVTTNLETRIERVQARDHSSAKEIQKRVENQMNDAERLKYADYIIENNSTLETLALKVSEIHKKLLKLK